MREIKFRGKATMTIEELNCIGIHHENGWIIGNLVVNGNQPFIVGDLIEIDEEYIIHEFWASVDAESVGQYTGVEDKDGVGIYEKTFVDMGNVYLVKWSNIYCGFRLFSKDGSSTGLNPYHMKDYKAIGNVYENPELLEGESNE